MRQNCITVMIFLNYPLGYYKSKVVGLKLQNRKQSTSAQPKEKISFQHDKISSEPCSAVKALTESRRPSGTPMSL